MRRCQTPLFRKVVIMYKTDVTIDVARGYNYLLCIY